MSKPVAGEFAAPDPTPFIFLVAAGLALLWAAEHGQASLLIAASILLPAFAYQLWHNRMLATAAMIVAPAFGRFFVDISGLKAYPEHIAVGALALLVPFWLKSSAYRPKWILADSMLVAFLASSVLSSTVGSPDPGQTLRGAIQQCLVVAPYFLLRLLVTDEGALRRAFNVLLAIGTLEAAYTIVSFFSSLFFGTMFGMEQDAYGAIAAPYGTQREPNIVGSYCGACLIMLVVIYFTRPSKKLVVAIALNAAAVALSLSRSAVGAVVIALIVTLIYGLKVQVPSKRLVKAGAAILAAWLVVAPALVQIYKERLRSMTVSDVAEDDTVAGRLLINALALQDVLENPFIGTGTASFKITADTERMGEGFEGAWIGNSELRILHDTGALGLAVMLSFLYFLLRASVKLLKRGPHAELLALVLGGIVYFIAFQATEGSLLAFPWVHLGLIGCAIALRREQLADPSAANAPEQVAGG
ncbi:MAG TPA: O-antigen ligase family protein [Terriglobales bacterium]|nr:O-antigen ligase family protein [Terriglobales bacterium]